MDIQALYNDQLSGTSQSAFKCHFFCTFIPYTLSLHAQTRDTYRDTDKM